MLVMPGLGRLPGGFRVDDGSDQGGLHVVDVTGDLDVRRDLRRPQDPLHVGADGARRVQDRRVGQGPLVDADPLRVAVAQVVVGQQGRSAVRVVNDRDLEPRALGALVWTR